MKKVFFLLAISFFFFGCSHEKNVFEVPKTLKKETLFEQNFLRDGLTTNTAISEIPLNEILGGGPKKDGIPALIDPQEWHTAEEASTWLTSENQGVLYEYNGEKRFYPYAILYWHEIVNDAIDNHFFAITFCPLCGSVLIFDPAANGERMIFGVSGKLWQSNLLMYDKATESLWSQLIGKAVVGEETGTILPLLEGSVITFDELQKNHPTAKVLSKNTGYRRNYSRSPYGTYEESADIMFSVEKSDDTFHSKTLFIVANIDDTSVGFHREKLQEKENAEIKVGEKIITAKKQADGTLAIFDREKRIPHYITMWFAWVTHEEKERIFWGE